MLWLNRICIVLLLIILSFPTASPGDATEDQFNFATGLLIKKEYDMAEEEFEDLLQKKPDFEKRDIALYRLGESRYHQKKNAKAIEAYQEVVTKHTESEKLPQSYFRLGQLMSEKDHRKAAGYYAKLAEKWPDNKLVEAAMYWNAEELFLCEDWRNAVSVYRKALEKFPGGRYEAHSIYSICWAELKQGNNKAATTAARKFLGKFPDHELSAECKIKLADSLHKQKSHAEAATIYAELKNGTGKTAKEAAIGYAWSLYDQKKLKEASAAFLGAAKVLGEDERGEIAVFNAGNSLVEAEQYAEAESIFKGLAKKDAEGTVAPEAQYWQGYCLVRQKEFKKAEVVLEKLVSAGRAGKRIVEAKQVLAEAKFGAGKHAEAATIYADIAENHRDHDLADEAGYSRMLALEKEGSLGEAEKAGTEFLSAFEKSKIRHLVVFARAEYRFRQDKFKEAKTDLDEFLAGKDHGDLEDDALYKQGWCCMKLEEPSTAAGHFKSLATKFPESPLAAEGSYMGGRALEKAGKKDAAIKQYEECLKSFAKSEFAERSDLALAVLALDKGEAAAALERTRAFVAKSDASAALSEFAHLYMGEALNDLKKYEEAINAYKKVTATSPAGTDAAYGKAWALRKLDKHEQAAAIFGEIAAGESPKTEDAAFWYGRALEDAGKVEEADKAYSKFAAKYPKSDRHDEALYRGGLAQLKSGNVDAGGGTLRTFVTNRKDSSFADNAIYDLAWAYKEKKQDDDAVKLWEQLLKDYPESALVPDVSFRIGEVLYDKKDYAGAVSRYEACLAKGDVPFGDKVLYKLGWAYKRTDKIQDSQESFLRIGKDFPKSELVAESHYRLGRILQEQGKNAEAVAQYVLVKSGDFHERALFGHAECERLQDRSGEALGLYKSLLEKYPKTEFVPQAFLGKGHCFREMGAHKDAIDSYNGVIDATDTVDAASALLGIGYSHFAQEAYRDAAKAFLKVDILYGYEEVKPEALHMLSKAWDKAGQSDRAAKYKKELSERYPDATFGDQP
ncbi:MAG: tetratricopeptide repeat protein [Kiritimatiellia bacterium]|jgi:TolA-binding protein|nr:tetratricopeptide repeat protein [Kiritimatiellia bacterium]